MDWRNGHVKVNYTAISVLEAKIAIGSGYGRTFNHLNYVYRLVVLIDWLKQLTKLIAFFDVIDIKDIEGGTVVQDDLYTLIHGYDGIGHAVYEAGKPAVLQLLGQRDFAF
jgi:hypothetical protein